MKWTSFLFFLAVSGCTPNLSGQLVAGSGQLAVTPDAKVNVTRLDRSDAVTGSVNHVSIGDVNPDGSFTVTLDASEGEYLVEAVVPGYAVASQKVNLAENDTVRLILQPVGKPNAGVIGANMQSDPGVGSGGATLTPPKL